VHRTVSVSYSGEYRETVFGTHSICNVSFCDVHLRGGGGGLASRLSDASRYLYDGLGELQPAAQHAVQLVPLVLQGAQLRLQLGLGLLVPHGEELAAHLQSVDEAALMPLEQQLCVLREVTEDSRKGEEEGNTTS